MRTRFLALFVTVLVAPSTIMAVLASGCGSGGSTGATSPSASASGKPSSKPSESTKPSGDAGLIAPPPDAVASADASDGNIWAPVLTSATVDAAPEAAAGPCYKGFTPTGNADADVLELGRRCAAGMSQLVPPVKNNFKAGEARVIPIAIVPGCYRVIAVGGKGVKDVDLELRDQGGKVVAADKTPDDIMPMIHPNKEFCSESVQFLNLTISVKKGTGEVAGGVWKR